MVEIRVLLENGHQLGGVAVVESTKRCAIGHGSGMRKVKRRGDKELSHGGRDCDGQGFLKVARDRAQEYPLRRIKKNPRRAVEREIESLLSLIRLGCKKRCLRFLVEGHHVPIRTFIAE